MQEEEEEDKRGEGSQKGMTKVVVILHGSCMNGGFAR